jgi:hypothetical protein
MLCVRRDEEKCGSGERKSFLENERKEERK